MSYKLLICALLLCGIIVIDVQYKSFRESRFKDYLRMFNKSYGDVEFSRRLVYFEDSLQEIERLNHGRTRTGAVHGLTKFSDWSKEESSNIFLKAVPSCKNYKEDCGRRVDFKGFVINSKMIKLRMIFGIEGFKNQPKIQEQLDWREKGMIGDVDNQKLCNGCWAFGIVGVMEAMAAIRNLSRDQLSVQQLLDCSKVNKGCKGGNIDTALELLCLNHMKLTTEDRYPTKLVQETCRPLSGVRGIRRYAIYCNLKDDSLLENMQQGPVLAVVNPTGWLNYNSGIVTRNCFSDPLASLFHVVQIVGYGTEDNVPYYIVKNSWGSDWGENGYIRIARDKNLCGINEHIVSLDVL